MVSKQLKLIFVLECLDPTSYVCQDLQMDKLFDYVKQANEE